MTVAQTHRSVADVESVLANARRPLHPAEMVSFLKPMTEELALLITAVNLNTDNIAALPLTSTAFSAATTLTLAAGAVTITQGLHKVDTEAAAASDDLDTITGGVAGSMLVIFPADDARSVVIRHAVDNIICPGAENITLAEDDDYALLIRGATNWTVLAFKTLSKSGGGLGASLASIANAKGASLIGVEDAGTATTAATVEAWLAELGAIAKDSVDGHHNVRVAKVTIDPSLTAGERTIAVHATAVSLPDNAVVVRSYYNVITPFTSATDAATVSLSIPTDDVDGIKAAIAISNGANPWDAGWHEGIQVGTAASFSEQTTAARAISFEVAVEALTAGKMVVYLEYVVGV